MLPLWADIAILLALPVTLGAVLWKWGGDGPDNTFVHHQGDEGSREEPGAMAEAA